MSANLYTIENLLIGKTYKSKTLTGEILSAEKDSRAIWYGEDIETYLVRVRDTYGGYTYRTIGVSVA